MKAIIAAFQSAMTTLKAKGDAALATITSPIDQIEGANQVAAAINTLKWVKENVEEWLSNVATLEQKFDEELTTQVAAAISAKVAAGEYMAKADVETAVAAAELNGKNLAEAAFAAQAAAAKLVSDRRAELTTVHGAEVAASLSDESLQGDDAAFTAFKTELARRVTDLGALGVTAAAKKVAFQQIACGIPFDEAGRKSFDDRLAGIRELVNTTTPAPGSAQAAASTPTAPVPGSGQPPAASAGSAPAKADDSTEEKPVYGF